MKEIEKWRGAVAKVAGRSHDKKGVPCQDSVGVYNDDEISILALSDGAGSCSHSQYGSKIAVDTIIKLFKNEFENIENMDAIKAKRYIISTILREIKKEMINYKDTVLKDFSGTLLFVAVKEERLIIGHIGDGIIGGVKKNNEIIVLSKPQNGELANSTYFFTMEDIENQFVLMKGIVKDTKAFVVMSDGTGNSLYSTKQEKLSNGILRLVEWRDELDSQFFEKILYENLDKVIKNKTTDDCSLGILYKYSKNLDEVINLESSELKQELVGLNLGDEKGIGNFSKVYKEFSQVSDTEKKQISVKKISRLAKLPKKIVKRHLSRIYKIKN